MRQGCSLVLIPVYYSSATEMQFTAVIVPLHLFIIVPLAASVIQSLATSSLENHATPSCSDFRCVRWPKEDADRSLKHLQ